MKQLWHNITTSAAATDAAAAKPGGGHWTKQINLPVEKICEMSVCVCAFVWSCFLALLL